MDKPIIVTPQNWRIIVDHIHDKCMEKMEIERGTLTEVMFLTMAMGGEKEGVLNEVKKIWRDGPTEEGYKNLAKECADVLIYMQHLLSCLGLNATGIIMMKVQELVARDNFQQYLEGVHEALKKAQN